MELSSPDGACPGSRAPGQGQRWEGPEWDSLFRLERGTHHAS